MAAGVRQKQTVRGRLSRALRLKLYIPILRSRKMPEHTARSVAVGLLWAFTPTFGVQMWLTLIHWYVSRTFFGKDFNVVLAMAWTWVTNVFTVVPVYYVIFLLGQLCLGNWNDLTGYEGFQKFLKSAMIGPGGLDSWSHNFAIIVEGWWLKMVVGSVPVAALAYIIGYRWAMKLVLRWRSLRRQRRSTRRAAV